MMLQPWVLLKNIFLQMEKDKLQEKRRLVEEDLTKLMKDKENVTRLTKDREDMARLLNDKEDIIRLMKEKEEMVRLMKEKEDRASLKKGKDEDINQLANEPIAKPIVYKDELISLMKGEESNKNTIMILKLELEATKSSYEESQSLLESKKEDVLKLLKVKENSDNVISQLRQELATARISHETYIQELKTRALQENRELEHRIKEVELKLENSTKRGRYLEDLMESRIQTWDQKEIMLNQFVGLQVQNIQVFIGYKC
jgi:kinesin family protein C2/C3